jgi:hypothetical protein
VVDLPELRVPEAVKWGIFAKYNDVLLGIISGSEAIVTQLFKFFSIGVTWALPCVTKMKINIKIREKNLFRICMDLFCKLRPDF